MLESPPMLDNTVINVKRAVIKARILIGSYYPQADRDKFHSFGTTSPCPFCSAASKDRLHFLIACASLNQVRQPYITEIKKRLLQQNTARCVSPILNDTYEPPRAVNNRLYFRGYL